MNWAAELRLFTNYRFDEWDKAASLFQFLNAAGVFAPERFDAHEPVRKAYAPDALDEPISLLSGHPQHLYGEILLRGAKGNYLAWLKWNQASVVRWHIYLSQRFFDRPAAVEELIEFVAGLCSRFPPLYGGAAPKEDWDAKHVRVTRGPGGGETHEKIGLDIGECLPGIYWGTVFGTPVVGRLGLKGLAGRLPVARSIDLGEGGLFLVLRESPFTPELPERLRHDREVAHFIGGQYFFDKDDPDKVCAPVLNGGEGRGVERGDRAQGEGKAESAEGAVLSSFEDQNVRSPDSARAPSAEDLAGHLVTFLHTDVDELFHYSRASLQALDAYLAQHHQTAEYSGEHLFKEFTPALGAYLGEVLVSELGGEWVRRVPLLKSTVTVKGHEVMPFRVAYGAVYGDAKLTEAFDFVA